MIVSPPTFARQIASAATKLGCELPEQFTVALAAAAALTENSARYDSVVAELNHRAVEALLAGKDPTADKAVQTLVIQRVLSDAGIREAGRQRADDLVGQAIAEHADELCDSWISAVQGDCDTLADAATHLGDFPDLRGAEVTNLKNTGRLPVWSTAVAAYDRIDIYTSGFHTIATAIGVPYRRQHRTLLFVDDPAVVDAVTAVHTGSKPPDAWTVAALAPLSLANVSSFTERVRDYDAEQQQRRAEEAALRQPDGFDTPRPRREVATP